MKENLLQARIKDALSIAEKRPYFMGFLSEGELVEIEDILQHAKISCYYFWGGYEHAKRRVLAVFPDYINPHTLDFPIQPVTFTFSKNYPLTHRDFLGSFMALGIERAALGDILIETGRCVAFIKAELWSYFYSNIHKIGKVSVAIQEGYTGSLPIDDHFIEVSGVVSSARLDCIVAFLSKLSREKAANLVKAGMVSLNHREICIGTKLINEADIISIRKTGRFVIDQLGPNTAKGRIKIRCRQYK